MANHVVEDPTDNSKTMGRRLGGHSVTEQTTWSLDSLPNFEIINT